ncbi:hypothetical protein H0H93_013238, partial [Arthromyces matolae]
TQPNAHNFYPIPQDEHRWLPRGAPYPRSMPRVYPNVPYPQYPSTHWNPHQYPLHFELFPPSPPLADLRAPAQWESPNAQSFTQPPSTFYHGPSPRNAAYFVNRTRDLMSQLGYTDANDTAEFWAQRLIDLREAVFNGTRTVPIEMLRRDPRLWHEFEYLCSKIHTLPKPRQFLHPAQVELSFHAQRQNSQDGPGAKVEDFPKVSNNFHEVRPVTTSIQNEAAKSKDPSKTQGPEHPSMTTGEDESIPTLVYVEEKGKPHSFTISQGGEENQFAVKLPVDFDTFSHSSRGPIPRSISEAQPRNSKSMRPARIEPEQDSGRITAQNHPSPPPSSFAIQAELFVPPRNPFEMQPEDRSLTSNNNRPRNPFVNPKIEPPPYNFNTPRSEEGFRGPRRPDPREQRWQTEEPPGGPPGGWEPGIGA